MVEKSKSGAGKFFLGALLGGLAGAIAGRFATAKAEETEARNEDNEHKCCDECKCDEKPETKKEPTKKKATEAKK